MSIIEKNINNLHKVSEPVPMDNKELVDEIEYALLHAFDTLQGALQGISAIQVRYAYRAMLLRYHKGDKPIVIYNPKILFSIGNEESNEGCLSEGNRRYVVYRPILMGAKYYDKDGDVNVAILTYKKARIFMHEYDHLEGILLQDKGRMV